MSSFHSESQLEHVVCDFPAAASLLTPVTQFLDWFPPHVNTFLSFVLFKAQLHHSFSLQSFKGLWVVSFISLYSKYVNKSLLFNPITKKRENILSHIRDCSQSVWMTPPPPRHTGFRPILLLLCLVFTHPFHVSPSFSGIAAVCEREPCWAACVRAVEAALQLKSSAFSPTVGDNRTKQRLRRINCSQIRRTSHSTAARYPNRDQHFERKYICLSFCLDSLLECAKMCGQWCSGCAKRQISAAEIPAAQALNACVTQRLLHKHFKLFCNLSLPCKNENELMIFFLFKTSFRHFLFFHLVALRHLLFIVLTPSCIALQWLSISNRWACPWTLMTAVSKTTGAVDTSWSQLCSCPMRGALILAPANTAPNPLTCCWRYNTEH